MGLGGVEEHGRRGDRGGPGRGAGGDPGGRGPVAFEADA